MNILLIFLMFNYLFVMGCSAFYNRGLKNRRTLFFRVLFRNKITHIPVFLFLLQILNIAFCVEVIAFYNEGNVLQIVIDYLIVVEFFLITIAFICLYVRKEIKEKRLTLYIFLQYVIILIVVLDIAGVVNISLYKDKKYIHTDEVIYETIRYHNMKQYRTDTEYFEIFEKDSKNHYRIEYDQIQYFNDSDFIYKVNTGDQILITYMEKEKFRTVIGLELDGYSFFKLSPEEIDDIDFAEWRSWFKYSTFPLVISILILAIRKLIIHGKRKNLNKRGNEEND